MPPPALSNASVRTRLNRRGTLPINVSPACHFITICTRSRAQREGFADNANRAAAHGIITPENVRPVSKNPIIAAFFKEIGRADELGSGTRNLYHYTRLYSGTDPIIDEEDAFSVTVPLNDGYSPEVGKGPQGNDITTANTGNGTVSGPLSGLKSGLGATDSKVIDFIRSDPSVTIKELQEMLNLSRNGVRKALGRLKSMGRLRRVGPDKGGHWEVVEK